MSISYRFRALSSAALLALALTACSQGGTGQSPQSAGAAPTACMYASTADVAAIVGFSIEPAKALPFDPTPGCDWDEKDGDGFVLITVVDQQFFYAPHGAAGFQWVEGSDTNTFTAPEMGGWKAGSRLQNVAIFVDIDGPTASAERALSLLQYVTTRIGE